MLKSHVHLPPDWPSSSARSRHTGKRLPAGRARPPSRGRTDRTSATPSVAPPAIRGTGEVPSPFRRPRHPISRRDAVVRCRAGDETLLDFFFRRPSVFRMGPTLSSIDGSRAARPSSGVRRPSSAGWHVDASGGIYHSSAGAKKSPCLSKANAGDAMGETTPVSPKRDGDERRSRSSKREGRFEEAAGRFATTSEKIPRPKAKRKRVREKPRGGREAEWIFGAVGGGDGDGIRYRSRAALSLPRARGGREGGRRAVGVGATTPARRRTPRRPRRDRRPRIERGGARAGPRRSRSLVRSGRRGLVASPRAGGTRPPLPTGASSPGTDFVRRAFFPAGASVPPLPSRRARKPPPSSASSRTSRDRVRQ